MDNPKRKMTNIVIHLDNFFNKILKVNKPHHIKEDVIKSLANLSRSCEANINNIQYFNSRESLNAMIILIAIDRYFEQSIYSFLLRLSIVDSNAYEYNWIFRGQLTKDLITLLSIRNNKASSTSFHEISLRDFMAFVQKEDHKGKLVIMNPISRVCDYSQVEKNIPYASIQIGKDISYRINQLGIIEAHAFILGYFFVIRPLYADFLDLLKKDSDIIDQVLSSTVRNFVHSSELFTVEDLIINFSDFNMNYYSAISSSLSIFRKNFQDQDLEILENSLVFGFDSLNGILFKFFEFLNS